MVKIIKRSKYNPDYKGLKIMANPDLHKDVMKIKFKDVKQKVKDMLGIVESDILDFKFYHKGYAGDSYKLITKSGLYFVKKFKIRKDVKYSGKASARKFYKHEIDLIKSLNQIKENTVVTPKVVSADEKSLILIQRHVKGRKFYRYLLCNCNIIYYNKKLEKTFFRLGKFLAGYHNKNFLKKVGGEPLTKIHGDLSSHNIMFTKEGKIFLFDPALGDGSVYIDLAKFFLNFYPFNFMLSMVLSKKGLKNLEKAFFKGYQKYSRFLIGKDILKKHIIIKLKQEKVYQTRNLSYLLKKIPVNLSIKGIIRKIKSGKIKIYE